ncbi:prevent-host-death family protein [Candidatus Moduliflexus flocculans]|uniref:Prevent-host-death family protein n=1 Tax=Candidatus Moduliflexus flocculans TaxID=1499966 RepID=A0A0S6VTM1_9BACT|nr:prevent-host-death family protein [Candidatus Moduliflexus flocculans]
MKTWKLHDAEIHFSEIVQNSAKEPQMVIDEEKPLAVVIDIMVYRNFVKNSSSQYRPTISELLDELHTIQEDERVEIEIPTRQNRAVEFESDEYEFSL